MKVKTTDYIIMSINNSYCIITNYPLLHLLQGFHIFTNLWRFLFPIIFHWIEQLCTIIPAVHTRCSSTTSLLTSTCDTSVVERACLCGRLDQCTHWRQRWQLLLLISITITQSGGWYTTHGDNIHFLFIIPMIQCDAQ